MFHSPSQYRTAGEQDAGTYQVPLPYRPNEFLFIIASDGTRFKAASEGWEHVSVSIRRQQKNGGVVQVDRCPDWSEMLEVRRLFWDSGDLIVQYMPPDEDNINVNPYVLHMWRHPTLRHPMPPKHLV